MCGFTLARGHTRSGDPRGIPGIRWSQRCRWDRAILAFAEAYSAQNLEDYHRFEQAIADGRLECATIESTWQPNQGRPE